MIESLGGADDVVLFSYKAEEAEAYLNKKVQAAMTGTIYPKLNAKNLWIQDKLKVTMTSEELDQVKYDSNCDMCKPTFFTVRGVRTHKNFKKVQ